MSLYFVERNNIYMFEIVHLRFNQLTREWVLVSPQCDITPETAAAHLRNLPELHYTQR